MKSVTLKIKGLDCKSCARTVEALIGLETGVNALEIDRALGLARISYQSDAVSEAQLVRAVEAGGYAVKVQRPIKGT